MSDHDVVGLGAMNMDHLYSVRNIVMDGEDVVEDSGAFPGGSAANTVYGLGRLGVRTGFVGIVGDDDDGARLVSDLKSVAVDTSRIAVSPGARSGAVLCLTDRAGRRSMYVSPGANSLLSFSHIDLGYLNTARFVHISSFVHDDQFGLQMKVLGSMLSLARISFSPGALYASKGLKTLTPLLEKTHVLFVNQREIEQMTGGNYVKGSRECIKRGCGIVVVTFGSGFVVGERRTIVSYIRDQAGEYEVEPVEMSWQPHLETTGAGDAFAAGFLYGQLSKKNVRDCAVIGDIMARFCITRRGARPGLPTLEDLSRRYHDLTGQTL